MKSGRGFACVGEPPRGRVKASVFGARFSDEVREALRGGARGPSAAVKPTDEPFAGGKSVGSQGGARRCGRRAPSNQGRMCVAKTKSARKRRHRRRSVSKTGDQAPGSFVPSLADVPAQSPTQSPTPPHQRRARDEARVVRRRIDASSGTRRQVSSRVDPSARPGRPTVPLRP